MQTRLGVGGRDAEEDPGEEVGLGLGLGVVCPVSGDSQSQICVLENGSGFFEAGLEEQRELSMR